MNSLSINDNDVPMDQARKLLPTTNVGQEIAIRNSQNTEKDLVCEMICRTHFRSQGVLVQFINSNCPDSASVIGGMQLPVTDIFRLPAYVCRHRQLIKLHAIEALKSHFRETLCGAGVGEALGPDDYSISFMMASVSEVGRNLHPFKRNEGPMFFCIYPAFLEEVYMYLASDGTQVTGHVMNAYIHLLPASQRRPMMVKRLKEEDLKQRSAEVTATIAAKAGVEPAEITTKSARPHQERRGRRDGSAPASGGRRRRGGHKRTRSGETPSKTDKVLIAAMTTMSSKVEQLYENQPTTANYPVMPASKKEWPITVGLIDMPKD